jgi:general secretion pathway protein F
MPEFAYKATDRLGKMIEGSMEAKEERVVVSKLQALGYIPIQVGLPGERKALSLDVANLLPFKRVSTKDVMTFTHQLSTLLMAGLPLDRSLSILTELTQNRELSRILVEVLNGVRGGSSLADALAKYPKVFSRLYVNMVRAGEAGGFLEKILVRLSHFLESSQELKDYVTSAMVYPILLSFVSGGAVIILLTYVIPKFTTIFADMGAALPVSTQLLLTISDGVRDYWWALLLGGTGLYFGARSYLKTEEGRLRWDGFKLRMWIVRTLIQKIEIARFARTFGTLIQSGVPILQSLSIVKEIISNEVIARSMAEIHSGLKEGEGISHPLRRTNLFPPLAIHMITVGEETGTLDEMLLKVADAYDQDVRNTVKRFVSLLEPALILFMALIVGFVVISMLMAIFSVNEIPF